VVSPVSSSESGAKGCEVLSGKLCGRRAKSMKFVDHLKIHSGKPFNEYIASAAFFFRQGIIILPHF
jgi:ribosomal protein S3